MMSSQFQKHLFFMFYYVSSQTVCSTANYVHCTLYWHAMCVALYLMKKKKATKNHLFDYVMIGMPNAGSRFYYKLFIWK